MTATPQKSQKIQKISEHQQLLIDQLGKLPAEWALTPVKGNKACYRTSWQFESPLSHQELIAEIRSGRAKGYGIRTGKVSGGIVAIDADGHAAHDKITSLSGNVQLPETVAFTSNKPGRCQYLFYVPQEYWDAIATKKIGTGVKGDDGKEQKLELRWDGCQSVLPPSAHPETGFYRWRKSPDEVAIAPAPNWVIEQMFKESGESGETGTPLLNHQSLAYENWNEINWAFSFLDALSPSRADNYDDWLAVGMALHSLNEDSLLLEWDDWSKMSSKYKVGECEKKWQSFKRQGVAIGTLAHMAKQDGWQSPLKSSGRGFSNGIGSGNRRTGGSGGGGNNGNGKGNVVKFPNLTELTADQINKLIDEIIEQGISGSKLHSMLNEISHKSLWRIDQLQKLHQQKLAEIEQVELRENTSEQLEALLSASTAALNLNDYLHPNLAKPLLHLASRLSLKPEVYLTTLLTVASSLHHPLTRIWLSKEDDFDQPANLYSAIIAPSSQKKSPVLKAIATKPLRILQKEANEEFKRQMEMYEAEMAAREKGDNCPAPEKPERKIHFFTKATGEGLEYQAARQPDRGMLYLSDELPAIIYGQNAYRQGKGSDKQDILSYYDGTGHITLRAKEGVRAELDSILLSILGGIQPKVMQPLLADCEDSDGNWARFMFVNQPAATAQLHPDGGKVDLTGLLSGLYREIKNLPAAEYTLTPEAFKLFQQAYNRYELNRVNDPLVGMQSVWGKCEGRVGRLALNLHVINALAANKIPCLVIEAEAIRKAIALTDYYAMQVKALYTEFSDSNALAPHLAKVIDLSLKKGQNQKEGWLSARDVCQSATKTNRPDSCTVREWFSELVTLGKGEVKGSGRSLQFRAFNSQNTPQKSNVGDCRQVVGKQPTFEMTTDQPVHPFVGNVGNVGHFCDFANQEKPLQIATELVGIAVDDQNFSNLPTSPTNPTNRQEDMLVDNADFGKSPTKLPTNASPTENSLFKPGDNCLYKDKVHVVTTIKGNLYYVEPSDIPAKQKGWREVGVFCYELSRVPQDSLEPQVTQAEEGEAVDDYLPTDEGWLVDDPRLDEDELSTSDVEYPAADTTTVVASEVEPDTEWQVGDRVRVDASDLPASLTKFHGVTGTIVGVRSATCLIAFDDSEMMHIPFRGLLRL